MTAMKKEEFDCQSSIFANIVEISEDLIDRLEHILKSSESEQEFLLIQYLEPLQIMYSYVQGLHDMFFAFPADSLPNCDFLTVIQEIHWLIYVDNDKHLTSIRTNHPEPWVETLDMLRIIKGLAHNANRQHEALAKQAAQHSEEAISRKFITPFRPLIARKYTQH